MRQRVNRPGTDELLACKLCNMKGEITSTRVIRMNFVEDFLQDLNHRHKNLKLDLHSVRKQNAVPPAATATSTELPSLLKGSHLTLNK